MNTGGVGGRATKKKMNEYLHFAHRISWFFIHCIPIYFDSIHFGVVVVATAVVLPFLCYSWLFFLFLDKISLFGSHFQVFALYQSFFGAFTSSINTAKRFPSGGPKMSLVRFSVDDSMACLTCNDNVVYEKTICFVSCEKRVEKKKTIMGCYFCCCFRWCILVRRVYSHFGVEATKSN